AEAEKPDLFPPPPQESATRAATRSRAWSMDLPSSWAGTIHCKPASRRSRATMPPRTKTRSCSGLAPNRIKYSIPRTSSRRSHATQFLGTTRSRSSARIARRVSTARRASCNARVSTSSRGCDDPRVSRPTAPGRPQSARHRHRRRAGRRDVLSPGRLVVARPLSRQTSVPGSVDRRRLPQRHAGRRSSQPAHRPLGRHLRGATLGLRAAPFPTPRSPASRRRTRPDPARGRRSTLRRQSLPGRSARPHCPTVSENWLRRFSQRQTRHCTSDQPRRGDSAATQRNPDAIRLPAQFLICDELMIRTAGVSPTIQRAMTTSNTNGPIDDRLRPKSATGWRVRRSRNRTFSIAARRRLAPMPTVVPAARSSRKRTRSPGRSRPRRVESRCGAVAVGRTYPLPPLSSGGALLVRPWLRLHTPLIERGVRISRTTLSDKTSRLRPRHVVPKPRQTDEPEVPVEVREWIASALAPPDLVLEAQPPAQPHSRVVVQRPIRFVNGANTEVVGPSA